MHSAITDILRKLPFYGVDLPLPCPIPAYWMPHPDHLDFMRHPDQFISGYASDGGFIGEATESWRSWALRELPFYGVDEKKPASQFFAKSELPFWDTGGVELPFWEMQQKLRSLKGERMHPWVKELSDAPITHKVTSGCTLLDWMHPPATRMHPEFKKGIPDAPTMFLPQTYECIHRKAWMHPLDAPRMAIEGKYGCIQTLVDTSFFNVRMHPQDVWIDIFWEGSYNVSTLSMSKLGKLGSGFFLAEPQLGRGSHHSSATY
ncbi:hypothetical protein B0H16DRAFT_1484264 [Mycena metata]|uniref:Uncharacterized protein n=1 Tax=Mycena metata TaxID=1033252 RepID=A0AAD7DVD3_9AGAR|nr:hypothetical protein B0H16DRAFT_1484264 [Mycena metata]